MSGSSGDPNLNANTSPQVENSGPTSVRDAYNVVADTATGLNFRKSDNVFQLKCILVCMVLLGIVGAILTVFFPKTEIPWYGGLIIGGIAGVVVGVLFSGIFLMIYRTLRHMKGKHD